MSTLEKRYHKLKSRFKYVVGVCWKIRITFPPIYICKQIISVKYVKVYVVPKGGLYEMEIQLDMSLREYNYCVHGLLLVLICTIVSTQQTVI